MDVIKTSLAACQKAKLFAEPATTVVTYEPKVRAAGEISLPKGTSHPTLPRELEGLVEQKAEGDGKKAKLSLVISHALDETQAARLKEAYGRIPKLNSAIDKAIKSLKADDESGTEDGPDDGDGE